MPRADHYPPDIMDRYAAFISAVNELKSQIEEWERRYNPNQPRIPAGQPRGGQWSGGSGDPSRPFEPRIRGANGLPHPAAAATRAALRLPPLPADSQFGVPRDAEINPPDGMRPNVQQIQTRSMRRMKEIIGKPAPGHQYDHVMERHQIKYVKDRPPNDPRVVDQTSNLMELPIGVHKCKTKRFASKILGQGITLRKSLRGAPVEVQFNVGLAVIAECTIEEERKKTPEALRQPNEDRLPSIQNLPASPNLKPANPLEGRSPAGGGGRSGGRGPSTIPIKPGLNPFPGIPRAGQFLS